MTPRALVRERFAAELARASLRSDAASLRLRPCASITFDAEQADASTIIAVSSPNADAVRFNAALSLRPVTTTHDMVRRRFARAAEDATLSFAPSAAASRVRARDRVHMA